LIAYSGSDNETFVSRLGAPINAVLKVLLLIALFWHAALGLQVVFEDYVHSGAKIWTLIAVRLACFGLAVIGIVATLRVAVEIWGTA
jgi:succinate dehydrogenase / fumarate reductase membrane anchor subunit